MVRAVKRLRKQRSNLHRKVGRKIARGMLTSADRKRATELVEKGRQEYNAGLYHLAVERFEKALQLNPGHQKALYFLGNAYYKEKRVGEAVAKWRACNERDPRSSIAGKARRRMQHVEKANRQLEQQLRDMEEDFLG